MLPLTELRQHGMTAGWSERIDSDHLPRMLIGQRVCNPRPSELWQKLAKKAGRPKLIYEIDDNLWDIDHGSKRAHAFFSNQAVRANLDINVRLADSVTVTTEPLADLIRPLNQNIHIVPNYLPAWLLNHQRPQREGRVVIGWGGSATHDVDWQECGPQIRRYLDRAPANVTFHAMGVNYAQQSKFPRNRFQFTPWTSDVSEYWRTIDYDIAVIPLLPTVFNQSKSHIKFLECAFLGIPVVASDAGPYSDAIEHGKTGFLVRRPHEWGRYLRDLVNDPAMRVEIGENAKQWARDHTIEGNAWRWSQAVGEG